jgi:3-hydroxy-9,10-secoandrosta-1,3,5(10)-triene-9,17-dione monooxygenase
VAVKSIPPPEPDLAPETLIARATALRPILQRTQAENDLRGWYGPEIHEMIREAGLYRAVQPRMFGGYQFPFAVFLRVIMELARGHPATAWCYTLASSHAFLVASHWSPEAQAELFGDGDFRCCQRAAPAGTIRKVDGGYTVDGVFGFCSGAPVATHFVGASMLPGDDGGPPRPLNFVVPREKFTVLPDWGGAASLGMQGSGSNSIRLDQVFVPAHHTAMNEVVMSSALFDGPPPGLTLHKDPLYAGVVGGQYLTEFGALSTGVALAALDAFEDLLRNRPMATDPSRKRMYDSEAQRAFGRATILADSAEALTFAAIDIYMDQARRFFADGTQITGDDTLKVWNMAVQATLMGCEAVELLFHSAGARDTLGGTPLERYFRDVQMFRVHVTTQPSWWIMRGQARLGLPHPRLG